MLCLGRKKKEQFTAPQKESAEMKMLQEIRFLVQDKEYIVNADDIDPSTSLNSYIRDTLKLTGTKGMCYEGGCGACLVVLYTTDENNKEVYRTVNSCLVPVLACNGLQIYTVEGIGNPLDGYHPVQQVLAKFNGTQCGFCSPGMVMNMYSLYESGKLTMAEVENSFGGNICRCTGYRPILSAFKSLCTDASTDILGQYPDIEDLKVCQKEKRHQNTETTKEPFYHLLANARWVKVYTLQDLLATISSASGATYRLVAGNTAQGVFSSYKASAAIYIDINSVQELKVNEIREGKLVLGANTTLATTIDVFNQISQTNPEFAYLKQAATHIDLVANVPVRNVGTLAGNLMIKHDNPDFPSDIFLTLETVGAVLTIVADNGQTAQLSPSAFLDYNMTQKVLQNITLPSYAQNFKYVSYKVMPRAQNAHAHVNAAFLFNFNAAGTLDTARIVYGNINPTFIHATSTENLLAGADLFTNETIQAACASLSQELIADVAPPEPSPEFRKGLAIALFYKAVLSLAPAGKLSPRVESGGTVLERPISTAAQDYDTNESLYPLTQAVPKLEALNQTSGQAQYIGDLPDLPHQLYSQLILAEVPPNSTLRSIDPSKALAVEGIVAFYSKDDIPGTNDFMPMNGAEEIFCNGRVQYYQQPIGILVGINNEILHQAADLVQAVYDPPTVAPLLSPRQVLAAGRNDRIQLIRTIVPRRTGNNVRRIISGTFDIHHQYHFHMETQCCNVVPTEDGLDIHPSSQWMDQIKVAVANMLKIRNNQVNVTVRRLGGAFGAKISRNGLVSCAAALAAWKLRRPVKLNLSLPINMVTVGKRFPLSTDYEMGVDSNGIIQYLTVTHYSDVGNNNNENSSGELLHLFTATYADETFNIRMNLAVTDTVKNTWARAPGSCEGFASIESIMEHVAYELDMDPLEFRVRNFVENSELVRFVDDLKTWANIDDRKAEIVAFNQANRWKKRGMAIVPMTYHFEPFGPFSVMVSIFHGDGTVQLSHGGIECGQGINTKAAQVCAYKLGLALDKVAVLPSHSFIAPNNATTGGSVTSEAVCYGIIHACDILLQRLEPYRTPGATWEQIVERSLNGGVNLSAIGQYHPTDPNVIPYEIYGVCATEVLLDVLTGQHLITRVDLIEDTGNSMSPMIDIGQVEGAYIMGLGYYTTEQIVYNYEGKILTNNTWTYYPPGAKDIPVDFRVKFPKNNPNAVGVLQSKATAEPPLCLAMSIPLAIRNAVASARTDAAPTNSKWYPVAGITNVENIFVNSLNDYTQYVL